MKKVLAMLLMLCLLAGGYALAEEVSGMPKPTNVRLADSKTVTVYMGTPIELGYDMLPEGADASLLKWSTSSKKIATVADGVVTPVKEGTATITVKTPNGKKDSVKVKVVDPYKPSKVELDKSGTVTLNMGETLQLNAALQPETAKSALKWTSSSKKIAAVNENGVVTPVKEGTATITVKTANGKKDTVKVKIVDPYKPSKIVLDKSGTIELEVGKSLQLYIELQPETAQSAIKWKSSSSKIAKVDADGLVTGVKAGTATITVSTANGKKDTVKVKVKAVQWKPDPQYKELKEALRNTAWGTSKLDENNWRSDPLLGAISGLKKLSWRENYAHGDVCDAPYAKWDWVDYETSNVKLTNGNWYGLVLEPGAKYSLFGFHPGMSLADAKANIASRSELKKGKTTSLGSGWSYLYFEPKITLVNWKQHLGLDLYVYLKNDVVQAVRFHIFIGA